MAFLWGSNPAHAEFDLLLEKTTSDTLPSSAPVDLSLSLQLADLIRSASVPPAVASKSLLKRVVHPNPNVQLLALQVVDVCIKNGGTPFLVQLADKDKEFPPGLEQLARGDKKDANRDVRDKALEKLQEWAVAFKGKDALRDTQLVKVYDKLKSVDRLEFPVKDPTATAAMVDSLSAPEWQDSSYCTRCRTDFSTFNRKHHCRNCGLVFDAACSSQTSTLPHYGIVNEQVRVCDGCSKKIKEGKGAEVARNQSVKRTTSSSGDKVSSSRSSRKTREEEDLKRAIEASLKESTPEHGPLRDAPPPKVSGYNPSYASNFGGRDSKSSTQNGAGGGEEEDADLAAAIAASLRDVAPAPTAPTSTSAFDRSDSSSAPAVSYSDMFPSAARPAYSTHDAFASTTPRPRVALPSYDLAPSQLEAIATFASSLTPAHPGPSYLTAREHELANAVVRDVQPRLHRSIDDTRTRKDILKELEWKLGEAARLYGAGLTEQNQAYRSPREPPSRHASSYLVHPAPEHHRPQEARHYEAAVTVDPRYQYHAAASSAVTGQPLPDYAVPRDYAAATPSYHQQQQQYEPERTESVAAAAASPKKPAAAGYYKPSSFPAVPATNPPHALETLPHVPQQEPWRREEEEPAAKVGELIEF
ncbi:hypothetical protein JCM11491_000259 [Sporobolomyces phaffii]